MKNAARIFAAALAVTVLSLAAWGCFGLTRHLIVAVDRWGTGAPSPGKIDAIADALTRPCGSGHPCGTLANLDKGITKIGDAIVTTQLEERAAAPHVIEAMDTFNVAAAKLGGSADALTGTAHAGTATLDAATANLDALGDPAKGLPAMVASYTAAGDNLNAILRQKAIAEILANVDSMTGSGAEILADGKKVTDKATADYLAPQPWWKKAGRYASDAFDYGALFARHTP